MATYTIPPGLTFKQKKAMAALLACRPCCGAGGSGSGSGIGGGNFGGGLTDCCGCTSFPSTLTATVDIPCIGNRTFTLTRQESNDDCNDPVDFLETVNYSYYDLTTGASDSFTQDPCDPTVIPNPFIAPAKEEWDVSLICCNSPNGRRWILHITVIKWDAGISKSVVYARQINLLSCDPIIFQSVSANIVCTDALVGDTSDCCSDCYTEPYTGDVGCEGGLFTCDISE